MADEILPATFQAAATALETDEEREERLDRESTSLAITLLVDRGLYSSESTAEGAGELAADKLRSGWPLIFDHFCTGCRDRSTFRIQAERVAARTVLGRPGQVLQVLPIFAVRAVCQRNHHIYNFVFAERNHEIVKIGQLPSTAEISFGELREIEKGLDKIDRVELGKALGLFAHDTGIGAFVYLRRVFERMIDRAYKRQADRGQPVENFAGMKMNERVAALKGELPDLVSRNSAVFSVLSIGIHELTEQQCLKHFPVLKAVLFQMLEQEEHKRKARVAEKETAAALQKILSDPAA